MATNDIVTGSEGRLYIGPQTTGTTDTVVEFEALSPWVEVELIESISDYGDSASDVTFASLKDARMRHAKGVRDAGTVTVVVAHDPLEPGQLALAAAQRTNSNYAFKNVLADSPTDSYSNSVRYFRGLVRGDKLGQQSSDAVLKITYEIGINTEIFVDPASL